MLLWARKTGPGDACWVELCDPEDLNESSFSDAVKVGVRLAWVLERRGGNDGFQMSRITDLLETIYLPRKMHLNSQFGICFQGVCGPHEAPRHRPAIV